MYLMNILVPGMLYHGPVVRQVLSWADARRPPAPCVSGCHTLSHVKTYWAKMEATDIATRGPPGGQDSPEHYFEEVLEGARLMEAQCSKNTMFK